MQHSFWLDKWHKAELGFHQERTHPALVKHFPKLAQGSRVLVPLCGKSKDMLWLAEQGYQVLGVELAEVAVLDFFAENAVAYRKEEQGEFIHFYADEMAIHLIVGDFFALDKSALPPCDALYDRAALVALPQDMRDDYVAKCRSLLKADARLFLISFSYDESAMQGPPFSLTEEEISTLWQGRLELIESFDLLQAESKFKERGLDYMLEQTWLS